MEYVCVAASAILAVLFYLTTNKLYNPGTIFLGYWAIITLLAALRLDNAAAVRQSTYALIFLGLISFAAGAFFCTRIKHRPQVQAKYNFTIPRYALLNIACLIVIGYSLFRMTLIVKFLAQGMTWGEIRLMHGIAGATGGNTLKGGTISQTIHDLIVAPIVYLIAPTFAVDLIVGQRNKTFIFLALGAMTLYSVSSVSRAIWSFLILYMVTIFIIFWRKTHIPKNIQKWLKRIPIFVLLLFLVILIITKSRSSSDQVNLFYNILAYLSGGLNLFDIHLSEPIAQVRTYGFFSLYGFLFPIFFVLNYVGVLNYPQVFTKITSIKEQLEPYVHISDHVSMNAYTTLFFNFYNDFGVFGVFLGSFIFGYLCMLSYQYFIRKKDVRTLVCYLILVQFMIFSMARIYTIYTTRALSFVWLLFLIPKVGSKPYLKIK